MWPRRTIVGEAGAIQLMYGNKIMEELRQNQKADVVLEHIVQGMLYSAVLA